MRDLVRSGGPRIWISITGYGRSAVRANRVAFGDDAAAAGGLVVWNDEAPLFSADALADPVTGLTAAEACLQALAAGGRWLLDVSMSAVSAALTGPTLPAPRDLTVAHPRAARAGRGRRSWAPTRHVCSRSSGSSRDPRTARARWGGR